MIDRREGCSENSAGRWRVVDGVEAVVVEKAHHVPFTDMPRG